MFSNPPGSLGDASSLIVAGYSDAWIDHSAAGSLATLQVEEMVAAWRRGESIRAEDILAGHPELDDEAALRLIYEELCLREEAGEEVEPSEIVRRFPRWSDELIHLLDCRRLIDAGPVPVGFPDVGEDVAGFRLLAELGRGSAGRVFLAAQPSLGDRPVAVKVVELGHDEHLSLARLQHMNIVPLYSEHVLRGRNLRILCMPFLGGATLAKVLEILREIPPAQRTGRQILEAMDGVQSRRPVNVPAAGPFRRSIIHAGYVEAICSIGAYLADGLQYAHERGLVHMDVKPSNVLLAVNGQPMLLDFHLAQGPIGPAEPPPLRMGGTAGFLSPEQRRAMDAVREHRRIEQAVDGRSDIYSLGMMLYVALGGPLQVGSDGLPPELHRCNPRVSFGLSDIIHKCLRHEPADRYPDVAALATDLRRHLGHLPLRGVPNRSWTERWSKWRRRRPSALSRALLLLALAATIGIAASVIGLAYRLRVRDIQDALDRGRRHRELRQFALAVESIRHGLALAQHLPWLEPRRRALQSELAMAVRAGQAADLHALTEMIRFRYGMAQPPADEVRSLIRLGEATWQNRGTLLQTDGGSLDPEIERSIRGDLLELVVFWLDLKLRHAPPAGMAEARRASVAVLDQAEALLGSSPSLDRDRRAYSGAIDGRDARVGPSVAPRSAWEHFDLGRSYLRSESLELAAEQFRLGLQLRPQDFWLNFFEGLCDYRLGRFDDAVNAFRVCIALSPETAECYYNRALAYQALGQYDRAQLDYDRTLTLNPRSAEAALNRGIVHYRRSRLVEATTDVERALSFPSDPTTQGMIRYNLSLVNRARGDRQAASKNLRAAVELGNPDAIKLSRTPD